MTYSGTLTSKGQITIPSEVRKRLGLHEGDKVNFEITDSGTTIRPARPETNPFARFQGIFADKLPGSIAEIVREERAMRGRDEEDE
jgi:AbrB family looped-hinge helix DNA binding protein